MNKRQRLLLILRLMEPFKWSFLNLFLCVIATSIIAMSYPYIFSLLIDQVFYNKNLDFFILVVISYGIIFTGEQSLHFVLNAVWSYLCTRFVYDIRRKIIRKFMTARADRLTKLETGEAMANINRDADEFMSLIHWNVFYLVANSIKLLSALLFVALLNLKIALLIALLVPVSYFINQKINVRVFNKVHAHREIYGGLSSWLLEMISGLREIKLFGQVRKVSLDYMSRNVQLTRAKIEQNKIEFVSERINAFLILTVQLAIFTVSGFLVMQGSFTVGGVIATIMYFAVISDMFRNLAQANVRLQKNFVSLKRVFSIWEQPAESSTGSRKMRGQSDIVCQNVSFSYEGKPVFEQLSLQIQKGEHVAIVGRSGVGKSTLVQLLQRFYEPDSGMIEIGGLPITEYPLRELRGMIGVVQQKTVIFKGTIRENIVLGERGYSDQDVWSACEKANLLEEIEQFPAGLDTQLDPHALTMSGGQLQRLSIARVLIRKPQIIVFDEATSALDGISEQALQQVMRSLKSMSTIITIAHNYSTILEAERILVFDGGSVVDSGTLTELLERCPVFNNLFAEQRRWHKEYELAYQL